MRELIEPLSEQERVALVALAKALVFADGAVSVEERVALSGLAAAVGGELFARADRIRLSAGQNTRDFLATIEDQDARERIYDALAAIAREDGVADAESALLGQVARAWDIVDY
jgi:hypothetical protein